MLAASRLLPVAALLALLSACAPAAPPAVDPTPIRAVSLEWKHAYNAGDAAAVTALYAADAVLSAPGEPVVQGAAAISDYFAKKVKEFSGLGLTVTDQPLGEVVASGDMAWQWQTYRVSDKSGALVDSGKLVTLFQRRGGRWLIAGDTWNSDTARPPAASQ